MKNIDKFTDKSEIYAKYRPSYPPSCMAYLKNDIGLGNAVVADVGAGTGIFSRLVADIADTVYAVEPNADMYKKCIEESAAYTNMKFLATPAEKIDLSNASVDFITVAQAFHWFHVEDFRLECKRILKENGKVILLWNIKVNDAPIIKESEQICEKLCSSFTGFSGGLENNKNIFVHFFKDGKYDSQTFENNLTLSFDEFIGRTLSSSYAPKMGDASYHEFVRQFTYLFQKYESSGVIHLPNVVQTFVGAV